MIEYITLGFVLLNTVLFLKMINTLITIIQLFNRSLKKATDDIDEIIIDIKKQEQEAKNV